MYNCIKQLGKLNKKQNHLMDLIHNGGGGFWAESTFSCVFFTFNVKSMSKIWKRTIKTMVRRRKKHSPL